MVMKHIGVRLVAASLVLAALGGCSDKDRETVSKKGDGTESFRFDAKAVPDPSKPAAAPVATGKAKGTGTESFRFDPKAVPRPGTPVVSTSKGSK
jgi:hypothetical protein